MEIVLDLIKILVPAGLVIYAMVLMARNILSNELEKRRIESEQKNREIVLPMRLQAYERMSLFLERISPENIIPRINQNQMEAGALHQFLLKEIRDEYNHNLSQQVYLSPQLWNMIKIARQETVASINAAAQETPLEEKGTVLGRKIIDLYMQKDNNPIEDALLYLKEEVQMLL